MTVSACCHHPCESQTTGRRRRSLGLVLRLSYNWLIHQRLTLFWRHCRRTGYYPQRSRQRETCDGTGPPDDKDVLGYTLRSELVYRLRQALATGTELTFIPTELCVDEYQDLNPCDLEVLENLARLGATVYASAMMIRAYTAFGMPTRPGYGALGEIYVASETKGLSTCMRCDRDILDLAAYIAMQDNRRLPKDLFPGDGAQDGDVAIRRFANQVVESRAIADLCARLQAEIPLDKILILVRSDRNGAYSGPIAAALDERGLKHSVFTDPLAVFDCPEITPGKKQAEGRLFLAFLHLLADWRDSLAWATLVSLHAGIGPATWKAVYDFAWHEGMRFGAAALAVGDDATRVARGSRVAECVAHAREIVTQCAPEYNLLSGVHTLADLVVSNDAVRSRSLEPWRR